MNLCFIQMWRSLDVKHTGNERKKISDSDIITFMFDEIFH